MKENALLYVLFPSGEGETLPDACFLSLEKDRQQREALPSRSHFVESQSSMLWIICVWNSSRISPKPPAAAAAAHYGRGYPHIGLGRPNSPLVFEMQCSDAIVSLSPRHSRLQWEPQPTFSLGAGMVLVRGMISGTQPRDQMQGLSISKGCWWRAEKAKRKTMWTFPSSKAYKGIHDGIFTEGNNISTSSPNSATQSQNQTPAQATCLGAGYFFWVNTTYFFFYFPSLFFFPISLSFSGVQLFCICLFGYNNSTLTKGASKSKRSSLIKTSARGCQLP